MEINIKIFLRYKNTELHIFRNSASSFWQIFLSLCLAVCVAVALPVVSGWQEDSNLNPSE